MISLSDAVISSPALDSLAFGELGAANALARCNLKELFKYVIVR
jgi:hypothetical protein